MDSLGLTTWICTESVVVTGNREIKGENSLKKRSKNVRFKSGAVKKFKFKTVEFFELHSF